MNVTLSGSSFLYVQAPFEMGSGRWACRESESKRKDVAKNVNIFRTANDCVPMFNCILSFSNGYVLVSPAALLAKNPHEHDFSAVHGVAY